MIEVEYNWRDVFEHLKIFKLGETIYINKEEYRLICMKVRVRNNANLFLKLTYAARDEIKNTFGLDLYDEDFTERDFGI